MALTMLNELPRYECLQEAAEQYSGAESCGLFLNLLRTGEAVREVEARYLASHGITPGRFAVMMLLRRAGGKSLKPSELAEMTGVTRATMTGLLDTLERDQLIRRSIDTEDRRSMRIEATTACIAMLEQILPGYFEAIGSLSSVLSEDEKADFERLSKRLRDGLENAGGSSAPSRPVVAEPVYA
jgi:Transcriptional regulators